VFPEDQAAAPAKGSSRNFVAAVRVHLANGGHAPYRLFLATSTGFFAVEDSDGQVNVYPAGRPRIIPHSEAVAFWSCASGSDPRSAGAITVLGCADNTLTALDVRGQSALVTLDCSGNELTQLALTGLTALENLYCQGNPLADLDLRPCHSLTFLRHASRAFGSSKIACPSLSRALACHDEPLIFFHPAQTAGLRDTTNDTLCAAKYTSPRIRSLTPEEAGIREIAYALKKAAPQAVAIAAPAMAALINGPCWLVPIPASDCTLDANLALARAVAALVPGARVKLAIARSQPVPSSTNLRRRGRVGLQSHEHHFIRTADPMNALPLYFVDNVITTGNTIRAARAALGWGTGLAYADASSPFHNRLTQAAPHAAVRLPPTTTTVPGDMVFPADQAAAPTPGSSRNFPTAADPVPNIRPPPVAPPL
jgi:hypothetical protein